MQDSHFTFSTGDLSIIKFSGIFWMTGAIQIIQMTSVRTNMLLLNLQNSMYFCVYIADVMNAVCFPLSGFVTSVVCVTTLISVRTALKPRNIGIHSVE
jgi:hypothetical protein